MKKFYLLFMVFMASIAGNSQNPVTTIIIANKHITLPCGTTCTTLTVQAPHIKQTDDYILTRPAYVPFAYTTATGTELTSIYTDDLFSALINLPFSFCFYGATYNSLVMGSNSIITFDATNATLANSWPLTTSGGSGTPVPIPYAGGVQNSSFSTYYPKASIMGPYHDIYPTTNGSGLRKIEWRVEGTAPNRRFIGSYNSVPMFSCTTTYATAQMVIYEGTGVIEVYVHDKPICTGWNQGLSILGIQNFNRDKAVAAYGKNCTVWGGTNIDSCYRFIPSGGTPRFKNAQLLVNGTVVATGDSSTIAPGVLNLNFLNICPALDSTAYVVKVTYTDCIGTPPQDIVFTDTIFVKKITPSFTTVKTDATCSGNGSITVTASGGSNFEYSINGGTTWQPSNVFNNVPPGTYSVLVRVIGTSCQSTLQQVIINLNNTLAFTTNKTDATCSAGGSITVSATGGVNYEYSINGGSTWQSSNTFNNVSPGTYSVLVRTVGGICQATAQQVTINLINTLSMTVNKVDANCIGGSITITASGGTSPYQYSIDGGLTYQSSNTFTGLAGGTYNVMIKDAATCTSSQQVTLTFTNNLTMNAVSGGSICLGGSFSPVVVSNASSYAWTPTAGVSNPAITNPVLSPTTTTTYTITGTLGTCTVQRTLVVIVAPGASANAGPDATIFSGDTYQMQATGSAGTYLWTPSSGLSSNSILAPVANPLVTTTYTLRVTTGQGCFATDDMTITVVPYCVKPMTAFTPNGDGINDRWLITTGNCLTSANAQVFNRYGAKVFGSDDYKNTWDGTYKGKPLPDGTYYYVISYKLINGQTVFLKGDLTILR
jgi:gliding motility-associated-like protein